MQRGQRTAPWKAAWKGPLRFGLVSFPVEAVNVRSKEEGDIHFHQLHAPCHSRIHYEKVCPIHGTVPNNEIVSGYEYEHGKYVEIEPDEIDALRTKAERALNVDSFVKPSAIDPIYFDGRTYYLVPAGPEAVEPYQVLCQAMEHQQRWGIGQVVMSGRDQLVLVRPQGDLLVMAMLIYPAEIRSANQIDLPRLRKVDSRKTKLAENLIRSWSHERFRFDRYENRYREHLAKLIADKVAGRKIVTPPEAEAPPVINLMDALKRSLARESKGKTAAKKRQTKARGAKTKSKRKAAS